MDEEKIRFLEEKKLVKTIEKEALEAGKPEKEAVFRNATNPIKGAFLKFASSKHKFNLKDI